MLSIVLLWCVVYLSGMLICKIAGERETNHLWRHLIGFFLLLFCQGIVFSYGQFAGWSFEKSRKLLEVSLNLLLLVSLIVCWKEIRKMLRELRNFWKEDSRHKRYYALSFWLFLGLAMVIMGSTAGNRKDAVVETVQTTLMTDTMNQYHPFTGQPLEEGVILSRKILTLPFWYSTLSVWTGLGATDVVWGLGSLGAALFSLMAFGELAGLLFERDFRKSWLVVVLLELMYLSGDYYEGAAGYRQLFYGYSGEVITAAVVIPAVLCILYRFLGDFSKEKEKLSLWGTVLELGICLGSCLFLTTVVWGILMTGIAMALCILSMSGIRLMKRREDVS